MGRKPIDPATPVVIVMRHLDSRAALTWSGLAFGGEDEHLVALARAHAATGSTTTISGRTVTAGDTDPWAAIAAMTMACNGRAVLITDPDLLPPAPGGSDEASDVIPPEPETDETTTARQTLREWAAQTGEPLHPSPAPLVYGPDGSVMFNGVNRWLIVTPAAGVIPVERAGAPADALHAAMEGGGANV